MVIKYFFIFLAPALLALETPVKNQKITRPLYIKNGDTDTVICPSSPITTVADVKKLLADDAPPERMVLTALTVGWPQWHGWRNLRQIFSVWFPIQVKDSDHLADIMQRYKTDRFRLEINRTKSKKNN